MRNILGYLYEYVKINDLFSYFLATLLILSLVKYVWKDRNIPTGLALVLTIGVGLGFRLFWLFYSSHQPKMAATGGNLLEMDLINLHAIDLTRGRWFLNADGTPSGRRPIGYPLFLGVLYKLFGAKIEIAWFSSILLYVMTAILIFLLARSIFPEHWALLSAFLFSVYPTSIYGIKMIMDEHLFLPVWFLGLFLLFREIHGKKLPLSWLWYGVIFGFATMIRTHTIFMPVIVGFALFLKREPFKKVILTTLAVGLVMQLVNLPWAIRNYKAWKTPVLYTATSQFIYAQVNSTAGPEGGGHVPQKGEPGYSEELEKATASGNEGLAHQIANREMKKWIQAHPKEFLLLGISRVLYFMNWNRQGGIWPLDYQFSKDAYDPARPMSSETLEAFQEIAFSFYYTLLFSSLFSIFILIRIWSSITQEQRSCILVLAACFAFWFAEQMIIYPWRKYRFPLVALMTLWAAPFLGYFLYELRWENLIKKLSFRKKAIAP